MMFILRFWYLLIGSVLVNVSGSSCEKFVNMAAARGVFLWNVRRVDRHVLRLNVGIQGFYALRDIAKITGCSINIERKYGLPFMWHRLTARKMLVFGAALSIVIIYVLSGFVWFVQIDGGKTDSAGETKAINSILRKSGVRVGVRRNHLDLKALEQDIEAERPHIAFASVTARGTLIRVEYVAKKLPNLTDLKASDIVADKTGVITKIIPFTGQARVSEGDPVTPGEILIEGLSLGKTVEEPSEDGKPPVVTQIPGDPVKARGLVEATTFYEGYGEQAVKEVTTRLTGEIERSYSVKAWGLSFRLPGHKPIFKEYCAHTERVFAVGWRKWSLPVEMKKTEFEETITTVRRLSQAEAITMARRRALASAKALVPSGVIIKHIRENVLEHSVEPNIARVRVVVECQESIGVEKPRPDTR